MIKGRDILLYLSVKHCGDWDEIYEAMKQKERFEDEDIINLKNNLGSEYVTLLDEEYPECLKNVYKPPFVLFYHGNLGLLNDLNKNVAVVGSRKCSTYSQENTERIIKEMNGKFNIVSGLALGIDAIAHKAALESNAKTIAVLGCGINYIYPKINKDLYEKIKENGLIISEYGQQIEPEKDFFPFRNRLITGSSWGVFIPEVYQRSGTMISVGHACSQNKDVMVLPQPANNETYNNCLIQEGACLVEKGSDILNEKN